MVSTTPLRILARGALLRASRFPDYRQDVQLRVVNGRFVAAPAQRALDPAEVALDLSDCVLVPGLINAHAHLELGGLQGLLPSDQGFGPWVGALMRERAERTLDDLSADAERGLSAALRAGVTAIGDIASTRALEALIDKGSTRPRPHVRLYREALDAWDPARTAAALERVREPWPQDAHLSPGVSPHAPFTVSRALMAALATEHPNTPKAMHWAETAEEVEWLATGTGVWRDVLGAAPMMSGLDLAAEAGLLNAQLTLVHANVVTRAELERVAAVGASIVHCPGTHAFFGRSVEALQLFTTPGLALAVGTDSLASNDTLDLVAELRRMADYPFGLGPLALFEMATLGGARALSLEAERGALEPGFIADAVALRTTADSAEGVLSDWLAGHAQIRGVLLRGTWFEHAELAPR